MWGVILEYMPRPSVTEVKAQIDTREAKFAQRDGKKRFYE